MKTKKSLRPVKSGLHVLLWQEGKWYVVKCVEIEVASQGKTKKEALKNIEEALDLYFENEELPSPKTLVNPELIVLPSKTIYA